MACCASSMHLQNYSIERIAEPIQSSKCRHVAKVGYLLITHNLDTPLDVSEGGEQGIKALGMRALVHSSGLRHLLQLIRHLLCVTLDSLQAPAKRKRLLA